MNGIGHVYANVRWLGIVAQHEAVDDVRAQALAILEEWTRAFASTCCSRARSGTHRLGRVPERRCQDVSVAVGHPLH